MRCGRWRGPRLRWRRHGGLAQLKRVTAKYHDLTVAEHAGYGLFLDKNGIACIDMPCMGAMGVHYANGSIVPDGVIDPNTPEALVYAPDDDGGLHLAAVEKVVFQADWNANHSSPPSLFGQPFNSTTADDRFGPPAYYSLHVWVEAQPGRDLCDVEPEGQLHTGLGRARGPRHGRRLTDDLTVD